MDQFTLFTDNPEYDNFQDKFIPKKTTDDCYTPERVYNAVAEWVCREYGVDRASFLRPFWPGEDYEAAEYPEGCVVVDNPPFSIFSRIMRFYVGRGIPFFLFGPTLTLFSSRGLDSDVCYIPTAVSVTYDNGANVNTSFVTTLDRENVIRSAPTLYTAVDAANRENRAKTVLPKYSYPDFVITATRAARFSQYGVDFRVQRGQAVRIDALDAMRAAGKGGKTIFGSGFLLSERAAAERAAAERAAAERAAAERAAKERGDGINDSIMWALSEREKRIIQSMGGETT